MLWEWMLRCEGLPLPGPEGVGWDGISRLRSLALCLYLESEAWTESVSKATTRKQGCSLFCRNNHCRSAYETPKPSQWWHVFLGWSSVLFYANQKCIFDDIRMQTSCVGYRLKCIYGKSWTVWVCADGCREGLEQFTVGESVCFAPEDLWLRINSRK